MITMQSKRTLYVEWAWGYSAWIRAIQPIECTLCVVIVIIFVAAADLVSLVSNAVLFSFQTPHHLNMLNNHQPLRQKYNLATVFNQVMSSCMICSSWLTFTINWSSDSSSTLTLTEPALMGFNGIIMRVIALNQSIFNPVVFNQ